MIVLENVNKIYCRDIDYSRTYAIFDILRRNRRDFLKKKDFYALQDLSFHVKPGTTCAILGTPEAGLTILAKLICGVTYPNSGRLEVNGRARLVNSNALGISPLMSVERFSKLISLILGANYSQLNRLSQKLLKDCNCQKYASDKIRNSPDNALKKLVLYACLIVEADIYVFDENFTKLRIFDDYQSEQIQKQLAGKTKLILCKDKKYLPADVDQVIVLHKGKIVCQGDPDSVLPFFETFKLVPDAFSPEGEKPSKCHALIVDVMDAIWKMHRDDEPDYAVTVLKNYMDSLKSWSVNEEIAYNKNTVVLGPFVAEIGLELLFWIPLGRWLAKVLKLEQSKLIAISRCGADFWYKDFCQQYIDVLDIFDIAKFDELVATHLQGYALGPQLEIPKFQHQIIDKVIKQTGEEGIYLLPPSILRKLFKIYQKTPAFTEFIYDHSIYRSLDIPKTNILDNFPENYIAIRAEIGLCFYDSEHEKNLVRKLFSQLAKQFPLVVTNTQYRIDIHRRFELNVPQGENIYYLDELVTPRNNLSIQSQVIAKAATFVGTHQGLSYLPYFLGTSSFNFYTHCERPRYLLGYKLTGDYLPKALDLASKNRTYHLSEETIETIVADISEYMYRTFPKFF